MFYLFFPFAWCGEFHNTILDHREFESFVVYSWTNHKAFVLKRKEIWKLKFKNCDKTKTNNHLKPTMFSNPFVSFVPIQAILFRKKHQQWERSDDDSNNVPRQPSSKTRQHLWRIVRESNENNKIKMNIKRRGEGRREQQVYRRCAVVVLDHVFIQRLRHGNAAAGKIRIVVQSIGHLCTYTAARGGDRHVNLCVFIVYQTRLPSGASR